MSYLQEMFSTQCCIYREKLVTSAVKDKRKDLNLGEENFIGLHFFYIIIIEAEASVGLRFD